MSSTFTIVKPSISNLKFTHNISNDFCNFTRDENIIYQNCPVDISWIFNDCCDYTTTVDLQLWKNELKIRDIVSNHVFNQPFTFIQDSSSTLIGNDYYFKITDNNNIADDISSNVFQIKKASFTKIEITPILSPCETTTITWDFDLSINKVKLQIWDGEQYKEDIVTGLNATDKSYTWITPAKNSLVDPTNLQIKIIDLSSIVDSLVSSNFSFERPKFINTNVNDDISIPNILHGIPFTINWSYTNIIKSLDIYLFNPITQLRIYTIATNYDIQSKNSDEFNIPLSEVDLSGSLQIEINDYKNVAYNRKVEINLIAPEFTALNFDKINKLYQGISNKIIWEYNGNISNVGIDLFDSNDNFIINIGNNIPVSNKSFDIVLDNSGTLFGTGYYFKLRDISNNATTVKSGINFDNVTEIIKPKFNDLFPNNIIGQGENYSIFLSSNGLILNNTKIELWRKGTPDNKIKDIGTIDITNRNSDNIVVFNENYNHTTSISFKPSISNTIFGENFYFKIIDENQTADDVNSDYFEIVKAKFTYLNILYNNSNKILQGIPSDISWKYEYTINNIKLDLIKSDGTYVKNIKNPVNSVNLLTWTPDFDDISGNNLKIKISDIDNIVPDYSSNVFEIIAPKFKSLTLPNIIKQNIEYTVNWDFHGNINNSKLELKKQGTTNLIDIGYNYLNTVDKTYNFKIQPNKDLYGIYTMVITGLRSGTSINNLNQPSYESNIFSIEKAKFLDFELKHPVPKSYDWCPDTPEQNNVYQGCPIDISFNKNELEIDKINLQLWRTNKLNMIEELDNSQISFYPASNIEFGTSIFEFGSSNPVKFYIEQSWEDPNFYLYPTFGVWKYQHWVNKVNRSYASTSYNNFMEYTFFKHINTFKLVYLIIMLPSTSKTCNYYRYVWEDENGFTFKYTLIDQPTNGISQTTKYFKFNETKSYWSPQILGQYSSFLRGIIRDGSVTIHIAEITQRISSKITSSRTDNKYLFKWTPEKNKNNTHDDYYIKLVDSANIADDISSSTFSIVKSNFTSLNIKKNNIIITDVSQNEDINISWSYDLSINNVSIEIFKDSEINVISSSTSASEPFVWKLELSNSVVGSNYKLRIKDVDDVANSFESSTFNIIKPSFTISKSNIINETQIILDSSYSISWSYVLTIKNVKLTLMKNSQSILDIINPLNIESQNSGNYLWTPVLNTNNNDILKGTDYYIQITDLDGFADDVSSNKFEIIGPEFNSLITNTTLYQNKQSTVTWDYEGNVKRVKIDLYQNGNLLYEIKNNILASLKTIDFTLELKNNMFGNNFNLKITDLSGFSANAPFSNSFNIVKPKFNKIELFHPNLEINFCKNMSKDILHETCPVDISWNTNGLTIDSVMLELWANTANGTEKVKDIANSVDTSGKDNYTDDKFLFRFNSSPHEELNNILLQSHTNYYFKIKDNNNIADEINTSVINIFQNVFQDISVNTLNNIPIVKQNEEVKIIWDFTANTNNNATIDLLNPNNSVRKTLANNLNIGDLSYNWIPDLSANMFGNDFKVRISDNGGQGHSIISHPFQIIKPRFNISKNNIITTRVLHGLTEKIYWSYLLTIKNIKLTLMKDSQNILEITNSINTNNQDSSNYDWVLPLTNTDISGTNYYILMSDLSGNADDVSSNHFELISPKFQNLSVNNRVQQEIENNILWDYSGNISNTNIELWKNTSKVKDITIYNTENCFECKYGWIEDNSKTIFGSNYYLKIKDVSNNTPDISSNLFQIIKPKFNSIYINERNLNQLQNTQIEWMTNGLKISTVKIEMWDGNGKIKDVITKNTEQGTLLSKTKYSIDFRLDLSKNLVGDDFYFKIFDLSDIAHDIRSENFTIIKPYFNELKLENSTLKVKQGDSIDINWGFKLKINNIKLELVKPDNSLIVIKDTIESGIEMNNQPIFNWSIPYDDIMGTGFKLKITDLDDIADYFISPLSFEIISPKFSSFVIPPVMYQNRQYNLFWDYSGNVNTVSIKLKDSNNIIDISKTVLASDKQFTWKPELSKNIYGTFTMDISDNSAHATTLESNSFTIVKPTFNSIGIKHPISGPSWCPSNPQQNTIYQECPIDISWNTNNSTIDNVKIELWRNNNPVKIIVPDLNTSGFANDNDLTNDLFRFQWTQDNSANAIHDDYYFRIFDNLDIADDISSSTFSINKPQLLNINVCNTQNQAVSIVNQNQNFQIKWNFDLSLNNIKIDLSSNNFKKNIVDNHKASNLSYNWKPILHKDMFGTTFKLHIYDKNNITNDISSVQFEIKKPSIGPVKIVDINSPTTDVSQNVPINIVWQTFLTNEFVQIILTNTNGDFIQTIVESIPGKNDFNKFGNELSNFLWTPDLSANMFGSGFRLKIIDLAGISNPSHPSNTFTIHKPKFEKINLVSFDNPLLDASQNVPITIVWKKTLTIKNIRILLTNTTGNTIQTVVDYISNNDLDNRINEYTWTPDLNSNLAGTGFRFKIIDLLGIADPLHQSTTFTLHKNKFTSLNVANFVKQNINTNINWDFDLSVNNVQLELWSTTPLERKQIIGTNIKANNKTYNWNPDLNSNLSGDGFKILIKDNDGITDDYSSNVFNIEKPSFTNINVSNHTIQDIETTITWENNLTIHNVDLELYNSSTNTFIESIIQNLINTNSYTWKPSINILGSKFMIVIKDSVEAADDISSNTFSIIKKSFNPFLFFNNPINTFHGQGVNLIKYERKNINDISFNVYTLLNSLTITRIDTTITSIPNTGHMVLEDNDIFDGSGNTINYLIKNNNSPGLFYNASNGTSYVDGSVDRKGFLIENLQVNPPGNNLTNVGKLAMSHGTFINYDSVKNKSLWCTIRNCLVNSGIYNTNNNFQTNSAPFIGDLSFNKYNGGFVKIEFCVSKWLPFNINKNLILVNNNPSAFISYGFGENKTNFVNGTDISNICILKNCIAYGIKPSFSEPQSVIAIFKNFNINTNENYSKLKIINCYFYDTSSQNIINGDTLEEKLILYGIY